MDSFKCIYCGTFTTRRNLWRHVLVCKKARPKEFPNYDDGDNYGGGEYDDDGDNYGGGDYDDDGDNYGGGDYDDDGDNYGGGEYDDDGDNYGGGEYDSESELFKAFVRKHESIASGGYIALEKPKPSSDKTLLMDTVSIIRRLKVPSSKFVELRKFLIKHDGCFKNLPKSWIGVIDPVKKEISNLKPTVIVEKYELESDPERSFQLPRITIRDTIGMWLTSTEIRNHILTVNQKYALPYLSSTDSIHQEINRRISSEEIGEPFESPGYFDMFLKNYHLWKPGYDSSRGCGHTTIFINLMLFIDGFGWKGSGKSDITQENVVITPIELPHGYRSRAFSLANIPLALSYASLFTGSIQGQTGRDWVFSLYREEMHSLARGILYKAPNGEWIKVFAFMRYYTADIMARKFLMGLHGNCSSNYPCPICLIHQRFLRTHPCLNPSRNDLLLNGMIVDSVSGATRAITIEELKHLNEYGMTQSISAVSKYPGGILHNMFVIELMHLFFLNSLDLHFKFLISSLSVGAGNKLKMRNAWSKISAEFREYTQKNKIHCFYKFKDADTFSLKAFGMKNFMTVATVILFKLKLVGFTDVQLRHVKFWEKHAEIATALSKHTISRSSTETLQQQIVSLLEYFVEVDCKEFHITTNTHLMFHIVSLMKNDGVPRAFWTFVFEGLNQELKKLYIHTNGRHVATTVFSNYHLDLKILLLQDQGHLPLRFSSHSSDDMGLEYEHRILNKRLFHHNDKFCIYNFNTFKIGMYVLASAVGEQNSLIRVEQAFLIHSILVTSGGEPFACLAYKCTSLPSVDFHGVSLKRMISKKIFDQTLFTLPFSQIHGIVNVFNWNPNSFILISFSLKETFRTNNSMSSYSSALSNPANNGNCNHNVLRNQNLLTLSDLKIHNDYLNVINEAGVVSSSPSFLAALELETKEKYPKICHQSISKFQGRFFSFLSQKTNPQRILELGCFTGYSTLCLAEGLSPDPGNEGREKCWSWQGVHDDRLIMTCDVNRDAMEIASRYFKASPYASFFRLFPGDASEMLEMLKESGQKPFDLIFIDADKGNYIRYFETIMAAKLLSPKGIIIADNVLFRHLVPEVASITTDSHVGKGKDKTSLKDKIQKIARSMHKFNEHVSADDRVNYLLLPIFDGIGLIWLK